MMTDSQPILSIKNLMINFFLDEGIVRAVEDVSLDVFEKETVGVVGESGCGKSITAYAILQIIEEPGKIMSGEILYSKDRMPPIDLAKLDPRSEEIREIRGKEIAMIFQEPMTSLSPVHTVGNQIVEAILLHQHVNPQQAKEQAIQMLAKVGIPDPARRFREYPHQMSGGLRQRAMIAMALSCNPKILIADEPTTALDVTIQAQVLALMKSLQREFGMSIMLITHDLGVVAEVVKRVVVMYLGRVVEEGSVETIFSQPKHPYTQALLESIPHRQSGKKSLLKTIKGSVPDGLHIPKGCPFHPRCSHAIAGVCNVGTAPPLVELEQGHNAACFLYEECLRERK
jgi:oligopeptide/dipeptide ABC transporter ATP-binding protein